jgi:nicotinamide-nucleotide amidase
MLAEIVSIGEELLSGDTDIVDTNSIFITKELRGTGVRVAYKTTVGDDEQRITDVIRLALSRADVIITTGGLGPTVDDMTRQGVANAVGQKLVLHQELLDDIAAKFVKFGSRMTDNNRMQAMIPEGAIPIPNPVGTAPGFIVEHAGKVILSVPGVPREMKYLVEHNVIPYLKEKVGASGVIKNRVLRTAGIGESLIDEKIGDLEKLTNPVVGLAAHAGQTDIRIAARAASEAEADALIAEVEAEVRRRMGSFIYGTDKEPLEHAFIAALQKANQRVAILEAGTDGLLRRRIEAEPGGATLLISAEELPSAEALRTSNGFAASLNFKELAESAAAALWRTVGHGLAIAIVTDEAGTGIGLTDGKEMRSRTYAYGGQQVEAPEWASAWGMSMGWHLLTKAEMAPPERSS